MRKDEKPVPDEVAPEHAGAGRGSFWECGGGADVRRDHTKREWNKRKSHFKDALDAVENPDEIWEQPWGAFVYLKVITRNGEKRGVAVVENQRNFGKAHTYYCSSDLIRFNDDRKGKLVYTKTDS